MKTILITGGAGFIGSHLCDYFLSQGHRVICVDSFFSGRRQNIEHLLSNKNFRLIKHNVIFPILETFDKIDEIYHLACPASPMQYQFDPILTLRTSVEGTYHILELARKYKAKLLYTSTSEVYGDPLEHPQTEKYFGNVDPLGKRACYDEGKRAAEALCKDYHNQYGLDVRIVRLFNVYGPRMMFNDGRVISNFILQALLDEEITVHGNGHQSRSFMYIDDLLTAIDKLMSLSFNEVGMKPVNLGNPDERSIDDLAKLIQESTGHKNKIVYLDYDQVPDRWGDPQQRCPDISRAKKLLGWEPKIDFKTGLEKTIGDFKNRLANKTRVAVFGVSFYPVVGPSETALSEITKLLPGYEFDLFVAKLKPGLKAKEKIGNITVYRLGSGNSFDKYLLPILAPLKAKKLHKKHDYQVAWGIMASYGALAAGWFSRLAKRGVLISLFEGKIELDSIRRQIFKPFYKLIFKSGHAFQVVGDLSQQQLAWLSDDRYLHGVDIDKGWEYVAKKTKEELQQLEILSSRF